MSENKKEKNIFKRLFSVQTSLKKRWILNNLSFVVLILTTMVVVVGAGSSTYYYSNVKDIVMSKATSSATFFNKYLNGTYEVFYTGAEKFVNEFEDKDKMEVQIIDTYGRVIMSSSGITSGSIPSTSDVANCIETGKTNVFLGTDVLTNERVLSVTAPIVYSNGQALGMIRYSTALRLVENQIVTNVLIAVALSCLVLLFVVISNMFFLKSILEPVLKINSVAKEIADGKYSMRLQKVYNDEIGELCETINYMSDEISRVERMKNDFISSVSHELRTPLTAISGWSETLLSYEMNLNPDLAVGLSIIHRESSRLTQMVEELLDFGRLESGRLTLDVDMCDISRELFEAVYMYRTLKEKEKIEINFDKQVADYHINADSHRLKQVFLNIIDNATKYGASGKRVDVSIEKKDQMIVVKIRDYGIGISEKDLPFVKQKFYKGKSKIRGSGIGLAVTDEIINLHGGALDVDSIENEGTTVTIMLPMENKVEN